MFTDTCLRSIGLPLVLSRICPKGIAGGIGITGGYVLPLGRRWGVEFSGGVGVVAFSQRRSGRYDSFGDLDGEAHNSRGYKLMPMNLGVTFIYIMK